MIDQLFFRDGRGAKLKDRKYFKYWIKKKEGERCRMGVLYPLFNN
jgi:hypothetical protein